MIENVVIVEAVRSAVGRAHKGTLAQTRPDELAGQVIAAGNLIKATDATLARYKNVQAAFAGGYTYVLKTNGEEHLLYNGPSPAYAGLNPQHPSSLVYAINVPQHAPILLGAMYIENGSTSGPQIGGGLTRWHSHLTVCQDYKPTIAAFRVQLRGTCNPATWHDQYTSQMLHVWVVPYPGGVFSDDLSEAATAEVLGCSVGTVKSATSRGLARLRELSNSPLNTATHPEGTRQ